MKKKIFALAAIFVLISVFASCEDEEEKAKSDCKERVEEIESAVQGNDFEGFKDLVSEDATRYGLTETEFASLRETCGNGEFALSGISADSGSATATDQLGQSHSFTFKESGDKWYLKEWTVSGDTIFYKLVTPRE